MSDARLAVLLWGAAFLARLVLYLGTSLFGADGAEYLLMADWMREGKFHEALSITYHPLYPLLVAAARSVVGDTERAGFWVSMLLGSGATVPLFFLARSVFGRPAAMIGALLYAVHSQTVEVQADAMTEGTFCFFLFWAAWLIRRAMEEPSLERSIVAGLASSAAYLTRPEGILAVVFAVVWPLVELVRRRDRRGVRMAGIAAGAAVMVLLAFPYLVWIHSFVGAWKISPKPSVLATEQAGEGAAIAEERESRGMKVVASVLNATSWVSIPFMVAGLAGLRGLRAWDLLYYFSLPAGLFAGLLWKLRTIPGYSYRYVLPPMNLLMVLAGIGWVVASRRVPIRWMPALASVLLLPMAAANLRPHRTEDSAIRDAAAWMVAQGASAGSVYSTTDKVNYFLHGLTRPLWPEPEKLRAAVEKDPGKYFLVISRDSGSSREASMAWLRESGRLEAEPVVFSRPKGRTKVQIYIGRPGPSPSSP